MGSHFWTTTFNTFFSANKMLYCQNNTWISPSYKFLRLSIISEGSFLHRSHFLHIFLLCGINGKRGNCEILHNSRVLVHIKHWLHANTIHINVSASSLNRVTTFGVVLGYFIFLRYTDILANIWRSIMIILCATGVAYAIYPENNSLYI